MFRLAERTGRNIDAVVKDAVYTIFEEIVRGTPVDKGTARSNWMVSLDAPDGNLRAAFAPGNHLGIDETANADATIQQAEETINQMQGGDDIYIENNVPYIGLLNDGSSTQAPKLFVEQAIERGMQKVENARIV